MKAHIGDEHVLKAMLHVPRSFVSDEKHLAYEDRPLSIGMGQTISQPYIVALMTEALELSSREKVLEIGTGSGYQTAVLAELSKLVITVERIPELARQAKDRLDVLGYKNIIAEIAEPEIGCEPQRP